MTVNVQRGVTNPTQPTDLYLFFTIHNSTLSIQPVNVLLDTGALHCSSLFDREVEDHSRQPSMPKPPSESELQAGP